jgi:hypothetical protein
MIKRIFSIDPGITHFAFVYCEVQVVKDSSWTFLRVLDYQLIDLKKEWIATPFLTDSLSVFFQKYTYELDECDLILVEWQPPMGISSFNELFHLSRYHTKIEFMYPRQVHRLLHFTNLHVDQRKQRSVDFFLRHTGCVITHERKHDISDAFCQFYARLLLTNKTSISKYF